MFFIVSDLPSEEVDPATKKYLAQIGRRGGLKSRRQLSSEAARAMVRLREARRAYRRFHTACFWSFDPNYRPTAADIPWIAERLREFGGRDGWFTSAKLAPPPESPTGEEQPA